MRLLSLLKSKWIVLSMLLAVWALGASLIAGYYWLQYTDIMNRIGGVSIHVNLGIDFGSNPQEWRNNIKVLTGMTLFRVTKDAVNVTYSSAAGYGVYIESIEGVASNATHGWVWWKLDGSTSEWSRIDISSDAYAVADNETFLWYYESGWPPSPPK